MKKLALVAGGAALAAGIVVVPAAGAASAATTTAARTSVSVATGIQTDYGHHPTVSGWCCKAYGGEVFRDFWSPTGLVCVGGWYNGEPVWW
jgi:hypothetical protein